MQDTKFTFKHLEPLESIKNYADSRVGRLEKYTLHKDAKVHFIFSVQKKEQVAEVMIDSGKVHFTAVATDEVLYAAIDLVMDKIERQLAKHKEKIQNHHHFEASKEGKLEAAVAEEETHRKEDS